ncbi:DUF4265 domain-containing protein [Teredinibacter turnerae]|uniref:DUF4265 domain-containing protein n=1 Tax=Teredinibacter turnerae (strain ATCC 39867 / T7901) TaxID=377629 RepID=C5BJT5_TERTT|nr:DUF4265 domain-containing protein [Teredinibacter turnerae]ACR13240.1 conserved hypothetical protein [Teredinibacter turnerae T7901]
MTDNALQEISLFAGQQADGRPVMETLQVRKLDDGAFQLVKSPAFVRGIASGDHIKVDRKTGSFTLVKRAGNLCIRVFSRTGAAALAEQLVPELEKLGGELDYENARMLVFSIHVSCGFQTIEDILNRCLGDDGGSTWMYGNVYDIVEGQQQPLNWWQEILKPQ